MPFNYCKKIVDIPRNQIYLTRKQDATFLPVERHGVAMSPMKNFYIQERIREVRRRVISSYRKEMFWNDNTGDLRNIHVGLVKTYLDKKETNIKKKNF